MTLSYAEIKNTLEDINNQLIQDGDLISHDLPSDKELKNILDNETTVINTPDIETELNFN